MRASKVDVVSDPLFGDEGKARVVDYICRNYRLVVRQNGGPNAGHRVDTGKVSLAFHQIPSSALSPPIACALGTGMVIDPVKLLQEIEALENLGYSLRGRLYISPKAHFIFPWHRKLEAKLEGEFSGRQVGTTGRGIGPCYAASRERLTALRVEDACFPGFREKFESLWKHYEDNPEFSDLYEEYYQAVLGIIEFSEVSDINSLIRQVLAYEGNVLIEGAQGAMLDVDHGTYPYVTSSNTFPPFLLKDIGWYNRAYMVVKSYTTRVGNGPLIGELAGEIAELIVEQGKERGETTGRVRRVSWLDTVLIRQVLNLMKTPYSEIFIPLTKLDVLDHMPEVRVIVAYQKEDGETITYLPSFHPEYLKTLRPVYEVFPGWRKDTTSCRRWQDLPPEAQNFIRGIYRLIGFPIPFVTVGPQREATIEILPENLS